MRLTAEFWVSAYRIRLQAEGIPAFVVHHGDDTAGAVLVKLNTLDGTATAFMRHFDFASDTRRWEIMSQGLETDVDAAISRQRSYDPDLWVVEIEDRAGRHLLDTPGLE